MGTPPYLVPCDDCGAGEGEPCVPGCPTQDSDDYDYDYDDYDNWFTEHIEGYC